MYFSYFRLFELLPILANVTYVSFLIHFLRFLLCAFLNCLNFKIKSMQHLHKNKIIILIKVI